LYCHPNSKVITTAPTFRQVEDILWRELRSAKQKAIIPLTGKLNQTSLDLSEEWFALGLSTDQPDRFQGYHAENILLVVDEAAGVNEEIFQASEGIVSSEGAKTLLIGNPTSLAGTFYQSFRIPSTSKINISCFDTPNFTEFGITIEDIRTNTWQEKIDAPLPAPYLITPEWVYDKFLKWGDNSPMWQARVMGEFPDQGEDTLIPLQKIEAATVRDIVPKPEDPEQIGADVARFGSDKTVFVYRKGAKVIEIQKFSQQDTMETSQRLYDFSRFHPFGQVYIDEIGVGAGVADRVRQLEDKKEVYGINVGLAPHNTELFSNLRAEMYWGLRDRFITGDISIPADDDLMSQLANLKFEYTPKGQVKIESKEEMKKRGLPSPDIADALCLAFGNNNPKPNVLQFMA
jgi:hypothetical protein